MTSGAGAVSTTCSETVMLSVGCVGAAMLDA